jgi:hypothetical protein
MIFIHKKWPVLAQKTAFLQQEKLFSLQTRALPFVAL